MPHDSSDDEQEDTTELDSILQKMEILAKPAPKGTIFERQMIRNLEQLDPEKYLGKIDFRKMVFVGMKTFNLLQFDSRISFPSFLFHFFLLLPPFILFFPF